MRGASAGARAVIRRGREVGRAVGRHHSDFGRGNVDDALRCFEVRDLKAQRLVLRLRIRHLLIEMIQPLLVLEQHGVEHDQPEEHREDRAHDEDRERAEVEPARCRRVDDAELRPALARCRRSSRLRDRN